MKLQVLAGRVGKCQLQAFSPTPSRLQGLLDHIYYIEHATRCMIQFVVQNKSKKSRHLTVSAYSETHSSRLRCILNNMAGMVHFKLPKTKAGAKLKLHPFAVG